jgi:hypothetical protein
MVQRVEVRPVGGDPVAPALAPALALALAPALALALALGLGLAGCTAPGLGADVERQMPVAFGEAGDPTDATVPTSTRPGPDQGGDNTVVKENGQTGNSPLDAQWAACMADAGYPSLVAQGDARAAFWQKYYAFLLTWDTSSGLELTAGAEYRGLAEQEVTIALADLDCREATNYRAEYRRLQIAAEARFVADHRTELEAFKRAAQQAQPAG